MQLSVVFSRAISGLDAPLVRVETHLSNGLPAFHIVGLPETAVRESKDRVRCAILNSHFDFPDRRITVNLAPADLPKDGGRFDLPIALGILAASDQVPQDTLLDHEFLGELALDGSLRDVPGAISAAIASAGARRALVVPSSTAPRAALAPGSHVLPAADLLRLCAHLNGARKILTSKPKPPTAETHYPDLQDVTGQEAARRALEIAAAGGHNLLFAGPPGTGKTLLASRLPGILPPLTADEALTLLAMRDFVDSRSTFDYRLRPFRAPHHSATPAALAGGGAKPRPGEISLAHGGVLFLDELAEFKRSSLEVLREPMESGEITLSRAQHRVRFPAQFQLVAAMNPCPCGYLDDSSYSCRCTPDQIQRYLARLSGPLLDRIDIHATVSRLPPGELLREQLTGESSSVVRARVCRAREVQIHRQGSINSQISSRQLNAVCRLKQQEQTFLEAAALRMHLSGRALHRTLRVARTIADLNDDPIIQCSHIAEALAYRASCDAGQPTASERKKRGTIPGEKVTNT
ncbi:MAG: YifB family Mg chelatase-like AAA ATPase [Pseudomonadota bacterium]